MWTLTADRMQKVQPGDSSSGKNKRGSILLPVNEEMPKGWFFLNKIINKKFSHLNTRDLIRNFINYFGFNFPLIHMI